MKLLIFIGLFFVSFGCGYTANQWQKIENYQGKGFYVFNNGTRSYFTPPTASDHTKIFLLTIPKSGTYFYEAIFKELGYTPSHIHLFDKGFQDLRHAEDADDFMPSKDKTFIHSTAETLELIGPGQVTPGHISYSFEREQALAPFKVILTKRNLRDCMVSYIRFIEKHKLARDPSWYTIKNKDKKIKGFLKEDGPYFVKLIIGMENWFSRPQTFQLSYETLMGDEGQAAQFQMLYNLARFLNISLTEIQGAFTKALRQRTLTSSGRRSHYQDYWSDDLEVFFEESGLKALNQKLGYE